MPINSKKDIYILMKRKNIKKSKNQKYYLKIFMKKTFRNSYEK